MVWFRGIAVEGDSGADKLPLGVTGNTPDSGSGESWFDPRRGNSKPDFTFGEVELLRVDHWVPFLAPFLGQPVREIVSRSLLASGNSDFAQLTAVRDGCADRGGLQLNLDAAAIEPR